MAQHYRRIAVPSGLELRLRLAAPYLAVLVFWVGLRSAWLAILAYHAQIVVWLFLRPPSVRLRAGSARVVLLALPSALAGVVLYFLLPAVVHVDLSSCLSGHGLAGWPLLLMVPYFGLVHPVLEQLHWSPLRDRTRLAHMLFAGYHVLVLYSLLPAMWVAACFVVLLTASALWQVMERQSGGLLVPIASHAFADLGIVIVAALLA